MRTVLCEVNVRLCIVRTVLCEVNVRQCVVRTVLSCVMGESYKVACYIFSRMSAVQ